MEEVTGRLRNDVEQWKKNTASAVNKKGRLLLTPHGGGMTISGRRRPRQLKGARVMARYRARGRRNNRVPGGSAGVRRHITFCVPSDAGVETLLDVNDTNSGRGDWKITT